VVEEKIRDLLLEKYQEEGFEDCFTVEIKYNTEKCRESPIMVHCP
jgi:hypothetical protein